MNSDPLRELQVLLPPSLSGPQDYFVGFLPSSCNSYSSLFTEQNKPSWKLKVTSRYLHVQMQILLCECAMETVILYNPRTIKWSWEHFCV